MIKEHEYRVLMTFGGGAWNSLNDSYSIARFHNRAMTLEKFMHCIHKFLAYGWIRGQKEGLNVFNYKARFGITQKGSDAMEFYKDMRYHHTDKKSLLSEEGRAMITLPGQRYNPNVHVKKES